MSRADDNLAEGEELINQGSVQHLDGLRDEAQDDDSPVSYCANVYI